MNFRQIHFLFQLSRDFDMILSPYSGFIGRDHFKSIVKLLGYSGIAWTVKECVLETCKSLIQNTIHLYLQNFKVQYLFALQPNSF